MRHQAHAVVPDRSALAESARLLPLMIERAREYAIFRADERGRVATWTSGAARLYGYRADEIIGVSYAIFLPPEVELPRRLADAADGRIRLDGWSTRKDGSRFWSDVALTALRNEDGALLGGVIVARDSTERRPDAAGGKEAERRFAEAEIARYAYSSSHDLAEPLHKIKAFAERLAEKLAGRLDDESADYLRRMRRAVTGMQQLVDAQLELSRVVTHGGSAELVDLGTLAKDVVEGLDETVARAGARIELGPLPRIQADPLQMRLLLRHLLDNALKFRKEGARPRVSVRGRETGDGRCELTVEDDGIGFDAKYAERIFEPFQRLHPRFEYAGSGMGLAICRRIVERHGGSITASGEPGRGARFVATLPLSQERRLACPPSRKA